MASEITAALGDAAGLMSCTVDDGVATIEFERPDKHNAISFAMWEALTRLVPLLDGDPEVEVIVIRGSEGGPFSAGADISEFQTLRADAEGARRYSETLAAGEAAIIGCRTPTVAAIEGFAIGGGTQIAVACDLRVCGSDSKFGVTPARLGIVYALPSTARLVEVVGAPWARWILMTGELLDAADALRIALVHEVVEPVRVRERVRELAALLASRAQISLRGGKEMIDRAAQDRLDEDDDVHAIYEASWHSPEYQEGVAAFLGKRPPDFRGARR